MKPVLYSVILILMFSAASATAQQRIEVADQYSYVVPADWQPMPYEVVQALRRFEDELGARHLRESYVSAGIGGPKGDEWLSFPYILIRLDTAGPVTRDEMKAWGREGEIGVGRSDIDTFRSAGLQDMDSPRVEWDGRNEVLWWFMTMTREDGIEVDAVQASIPFRKGILSAAYYYPRGSLNEAFVQEFLGELTSSVEFSAGFEYDEAAARSATRRSSGESFFSRVAGKGIIGGIVGGLIALVSGAFKKDQEHPTA